MDALLHPRTRTWTRTRTTRHTPAELLLLLPHPPETLYDDDIVAAADVEVVVVVVVAEEKQADVVVVANVLVEGTSVEVRVYVRRDDDQFAVAVVEVVVVVVVDGGQRWRLRHLPCTIDVTVLGACPPTWCCCLFSSTFSLCGRGRCLLMTSVLGCLPPKKTKKKQKHKYDFFFFW